MGDRKGWMLVAAVATSLAVVLGPRPLALPDATTGDAALARRVRAATGTRPGTQALAVAEVTADGIRTAGLGRMRSGAPVDGSTAFEIGSVTKALTGTLLADMDAAGIVDVDDRVTDITDDDGLRAAPVGEVTLRELAQHRSGLPRLSLGGPLRALRALLANVTGGNPYAGWSPDGVAAAAADRRLEGRGTFAYSNLGIALLGGVLAEADGTTYGQLLGDRLLTPLRMSSTSVVIGSADLPAERASGTSVAGAARDPWIAAGYAPAGVGVWSTAEDMATLLRAVMTESTPGAGAARPHADAGDGQRIGLGWLTTRSHGRTLTWHNGGTGGFASWVGFDRERRRGVVVLSASQVPVDGLGAHLLGAGPPPADRGWSAPGLPGLVALALLVLAAAAAVGAARSSPADRLAAADALVEPLALVVVAWTIGPWSQVPWWLWSVAAGVVLAAVARVAAAAWRRPWIADGTSRGRLLWRCTHVALVALIMAVLVA